MVKSLSSIGVAILLLLAVSLVEWYFVNNKFESFEEELQTLYYKTEDGSANGEDAKAVQASWERKKENLYVWIPHNDISRIDDYMSETVRLVAEEEFSLALAKLEILIHLCDCLPGTYRPTIGNVL